MINSLFRFHFHRSLEKETFCRSDLYTLMTSYPGNTIKVFTRCGDSVSSFGKYSAWIAVPLFLLLGVSTSTIFHGHMRIPIDKVMASAAICISYIRNVGTPAGFVEQMVNMVLPFLESSSYWSLFPIICTFPLASGHNWNACELKGWERGTYSKTIGRAGSSKKHYSVHVDG